MADGPGRRPLELHLIRHPLTVAPAGVCYGATDLALAHDPCADAPRLRALLPAHCALVSSPRRRCLELARLLHPQPRLDPRLAEIDFGEWEMQPFAQIERAAIDAWAADPYGFRPPQGETADEMATRVLQALDSLRADASDALVIVAHCGPLRVIAGHLLGLPRPQWLGLEFDYGRASCLDVDAAGARLRWQNK